MSFKYGEIDVKTVNTIRTLAADVIAKSNSGHPGAPLGMAPTAHVLFKNHMKFNPQNPKWINRDRFVLSNGHACVLQYILLHLYGFGLSMDDLKQFRQLHSKTPGHPENDLPGIEVTTGPLGQGISNAVGLAIGAKNLGATYNKPGYDLIDGKVYCFFGDGCMMEGVASEACSMAGHLQLDNLIAFYDDNHISIDGDINCAFTENVLARLESYGWHTLTVDSADADLDAISKAIDAAKKVKGKPVCIRVTTTIGYGSKEAGSHSVHGAPLKKDDIVQLKSKFGFNPDAHFHVPSEVYDFLKANAKEGADLESKWNALFDKYKKEFPSEAQEFDRRVRGELPKDWTKLLPSYTPSDAPQASRKLSEIILNKIQQGVPELIGGSADLTSSNLTRWSGAVDFQPPATKLGDYSGRYIRYGVREHAMGAIMNGLAAYGGFVPYGGTFLNFVSYAAGALRLSALSHLQAIWVATHDSIGLGEDGPTHQPIETLAHFRAIPNVAVWRPADGNETSAAYQVAISSRHTPSVIALSRQNLPQLEGSSIEKALKGGYTLVSPAGGKTDLIIVSTGSEVSLSVEAAALLEKKGIKTGVVSLPDWHTFDLQSKEYQLSVFPDGVPILSVEVMSTTGWQKYSHEQFGINRFGASGPYNKVYEYFEFTPQGIAQRGQATYEFYKGQPVRSPLNRAFKQIL